MPFRFGPRLPKPAARALWTAAALLALALPSLPTDCAAAPPATWFLGVADVSLHPEADTGVVVHLDVHARHEAGRFVGLVRPGIAWDFSPTFALWLGYTYVPVVPTAPVSAPAVTVQDLWQQALWRTQLGPVGLGVRARVEQRWHSAKPGLGLRGRLFVRASAPIHGDIAWVVNDEVLVNLSDATWAPRGLGEERLFVGLGIGPGGRRFELGYLLVVRPMAAARVQHTIMMSYFFAE